MSLGMTTVVCCDERAVIQWVRETEQQGRHFLCLQLTQVPSLVTYNPEAHQE